MSGAGMKIKADDVAALFRKEIQDAVARLKSVGVILIFCVKFPGLDLATVMSTERSNAPPRGIPCEWRHRREKIC